MKLKIWVIVFLLLLLTTGVSAQNMRLVRGSIVDESGKPKSDVTIKDDSGGNYLPLEDGSFLLQVPIKCMNLIFKADKYSREIIPIDGSYMRVRMKKDPNIVNQERLEAEAKAQARRDSLLAMEQARKAAETQAKADEKADEKARIIAEQERLAAEERACKEAEAKARAEEEARVREEAKRQAAEARAKKKAERQAKDAAYNERFKNKGLEHTFSVSYASQFASCEIVYYNSGVRTYKSLHPVEFDYTLSYKVGRVFSVGVGAGVLFHVKSVNIINDGFSGNWEGFKEKRVDLPLFATLKIRPFRSAVRPIIAASVGYYLLSGCPLGEGCLGLEIRFRRSAAIGISGFVKTLPYPSDLGNGFNLAMQDLNAKKEYGAVTSAGAKVEFSF
ncbi:MAG: hypothetical protein IK045_06330 [Bacteroidales bacterium]|nr:hypothetical protein [Bacteroidales bacterium]